MTNHKILKIPYENFLVKFLSSFHYIKKYKPMVAIGERPVNEEH